MSEDYELEMKAEKIVKREYRRRLRPARWVRVAVQCPYCKAFFVINAIASQYLRKYYKEDKYTYVGPGRIENPIKCPNCSDYFHVEVEIAYNLDTGSIDEIYVDVHKWDGKCLNWPFDESIDMNVLDLTKSSMSGGYYSSSYSSSDPKVGASGKFFKVGPVEE